MDWVRCRPGVPLLVMKCHGNFKRKAYLKDDDIDRYIQAFVGLMVQYISIYWANWAFCKPSIRPR